MLLEAAELMAAAELEKRIAFDDVDMSATINEAYEGFTAVFAPT